jgi:hypothetical protein
MQKRLADTRPENPAKIGARVGKPSVSEQTNIEPLVLDLVEFVASRERTYEEVMDAWRTSCPKLTVWEDANDRGLVATEVLDGRSIVKPTARGLDLIATRSISGR